MRMWRWGDEKFAKMKTIYDPDFQLESSDEQFKYQEELTKELDAFKGDFNQSTINEIVLWKVNRYSSIPDEVFELLNKIDSDSFEMNRELTNDILKELLLIKGIQIPMASAILRFRNPNIYQIIDQRVYRVIYPDEVLKISYSKSARNSSKQIKMYFEYLSKLHVVCTKLKIPFSKSDRVLYEVDKRINKDESLLNYGS